MRDIYCQKTTLMKILLSLRHSLTIMENILVLFTADLQKTRFRAEKKNKDKFIQSGLWALSRHPNYLGEIILWLGIAIIAMPVLWGWQYVSLLSPLFVYLILTKVSGIPILEALAEKHWGKQKDYQAYKKNTPLLFPR